MKYYKDSQNVVYAFELDGSQDHLIGDKVAMTAEEVEAHINPPKTAEQTKAEIESAIQNMLDTKAKEYKWDDMKSARAANVPVKPSDSIIIVAMKNNAEALSDWYFEVWAKATELEALGTPMTVEEVIAQMPVFGV